MPATVRINGRLVGKGQPAYVVAEMSANHGGHYHRALKILREAKSAGADAVKLQTYTPDTLTIDSSRPCFLVGDGSPWAGRRLYELYQEAQTPWGWYPKLKAEAERLGLDLFSSPFDFTAVDFLEGLRVPCYKVSSFEIVDIPLVRRVAQTGKPILFSTGLASRQEIREALETARHAGAKNIVLLKCVSAYPAPPEEMNLRAINTLANDFGVPVGLSDHSLGTAVSVAAVALGACVIEKHFTLSRKMGGPDSAFSLEPNEFHAMVDAVRVAEKALGKGNYTAGETERKNRIFRRSLFVVQDMKAGDRFTVDNMRSIRPGDGLHPRYYDRVIGRMASRMIRRGTPLGWHHVRRDRA